MAAIAAVESFEGGADGVQVTHDNTTADETIGVGTGLTFDVDQFLVGSGSLLLNAMTATRAIKWDGASGDDRYVRFFFRRNGTPPANVFLVNLDCAGVDPQLGFTSTGQIRVRDNNVAAGAAATIDGEWYRADWEVHWDTVTLTGTQTLRIYRGANLYNEDTATATSTISGSYTQGLLTDVALGNISAVAAPGWSINVDYFAVDDAVFPTMPSAPPPPASSEPIVFEDFESGADGDAIATTNTSFDSMVSAGTTLEVDTQYPLSGTRSMLLNASTTARSGQWDLGGSRTAAFVSGYFRPRAAPPGNSYFAQIVPVTGVAAQLGFKTSGEVRVRDNNVELWAQALTFNTWWRVDWEVHVTGAGTGTQELWFFTGVNLHNADPESATYHVSGLDYTQDAFDTVTLGNIIAVTAPGWSINLDYWQVDGALMPLPAPLDPPEPDPVSNARIYVRQSGAWVEHVFAVHDGADFVDHLIDTDLFGTENPNTVSELNVPNTGMWMGATVTDRLRTYDYDDGLAEWEAITGWAPQALREYRTNNDTMIPAGMQARLVRSGKPRAMPVVSWKVSTADSWADIAGGSQDARLAAKAAELDAYAWKTHLILHHEPENDNELGTTGYTYADYRAMFRHEVEQIRAVTDKAIIGINYMGFYGHYDKVEQFWPGGDVVDWVWLNPYAHAAHTSLDRLLNQTNVAAPGWPGAYNWAATKGKPIGIGETGFGGDAASATTIIQQLLTAKKAGLYPLLKCWLYWHEDHDTPEVQAVTTTGSPTSGSLFLTLNMGGQSAETAAIARNATATQVRTALEALPNVVPGDVSCTGGPLPAAVNVTFNRGTNLGTANVPTMGVRNTFNVGAAAVTTVTQGKSDNNYRLEHQFGTRPADTGAQWRAMLTDPYWLLADTDRAY